MTTGRHEHIDKLQKTNLTSTNMETASTETINLIWLVTGFQYDTATNYASNDKVTIGRMRDVCQH